MRSRWPAPLMAMFVLAALAGCTPPSGERIDRQGSADTARSDADQRPPTTDRAPACDSATMPPDGAPMRTPSVHPLRPRDDGFAAEIPFVYTNGSAAPIYLVNCNGDISPALQRRVGDRWEDWWIPATNACLSPPVVVEPGATIGDTLHMVILPQDGRFLAELVAAADTGTYRLIWHQALASFSAEAGHFGPQVPLEERVSNAFRFRRD